jgi:hypothetical protein
MTLAGLASELERAREETIAYLEKPVALSAREWGVELRAGAVSYCSADESLRKRARGKVEAEILQDEKDKSE